MRVLHAPKSHVVPSGNAQAALSSGAAAGHPEGSEAPGSPPSEGVSEKAGPWEEESELPHADATAHAQHAQRRATDARAASVASAIGEAPDEVSIQRRIEL